MTTCVRLLALISVAAVCCHAQAFREKETENRLKTIYERGEFTARNFQVEWLADSSSYTVLEREPITGKMVRTAFDVRTGQRIESRPVDELRFVSPDGKRVLEFQDQELFVRDLEGGQRTQLTKRSAGRDLRFQNPRWSPDGKRVVFVESDLSDVRQRAVLVPDDPSYPGVRNNPFARVGGVIAKLRVGVVDSGGKSLSWLPIESPQEGMYLGQVDWAGNSDEVLVEKFSRFRNEREFLLVQPKGEVKRIYREVNDGWVESSEGKNSGLVWVRGGKAFVVVSEKDGWRHAFLRSREGKELFALTLGEYDMIDRNHQLNSSDKTTASLSLVRLFAMCIVTRQTGSDCPLLRQPLLKQRRMLFEVFPLKDALPI